MTDRMHIGHRALCLLLALLIFASLLPLGAQAAEIPIPTGDDDTVDVLVIGNSFTTGWPDELCGMLEAAGFKANVYTASHGGTVLQQHWDWLQSDEAAYHLHCYGLSDKVADKRRVTLEECLAEKEWDVISIQEAFMAPAERGFREAAYVKSTCALAADMLAYLKTRCPQATLLWHQTWTPEVGYIRKTRAVRTKGAQKRVYRVICKVGDKVVQENDAYLVPTGTAFQIARASGSGNLTRDGLHDSAENGGQYLNACVWFECLTGQSCVGNTWRPTGYTLTEERIADLQNWAHKAVEKYAAR